VSSCNEIPEGCSDFKTGKFTYTDQEYSNIIIERNDSLQIERAPDHTYMSRIEWISECTYTIECFDVVNKPQDPRIGTKLTVDILRIEGDKYRYHSKIDDFSYRGWIKKIK
jgi:hypothetical protein